MRLLSIIEVNHISGAIVNISGGYSLWLNNLTLGTNFAMTVTGSSQTGLGNFNFYANKVTDNQTGIALFDGTQNSFCINNVLLRATPIAEGWYAYIFGNGHTYAYSGTC